MNCEICAIIVAAGLGRRMGTAVAKQYLPLGGKPVLRHSLEQFLAAQAFDTIVLVVPAGDIAIVTSWLPDDPKIHLIAGGNCRRQSVFNGLQAIDTPQGIVLIHDGVRPLVSQELIRACIQGAHDWGACIPAMPVHDTLKQAGDDDLVQETVDRRGLWLAQTPQAFDLALIREAHQLAEAENWVVTDDASLIERLGRKVKIIPGSRENIKITRLEDLQWAEMLLDLNPA